MINISLNQEIKKPSKESIEMGFRRFIVPLLVFVVILSLTLTFGKSMVFAILATRERITALKLENSNLREKRETLSSLDRALLSRQAQVSLLAVPSENSGFSALSAIRTQAFEKQVSISEIRMLEKQGAQKGTQEIFINLEVSGNLGKIVQLIDAVKMTAPIVNISKIKMVGDSAGDLTAELDLAAFWAALPQTLSLAPAPLAVLNQKDLDLLGEMEKLRVEVGQAVVPAAPGGKTDPFTE